MFMYYSGVLKNIQVAPLRLLLALCISTIILSGCDSTDANDEDSDPPTSSLEPRLSSIQANVFNVSCASSACHGSSNPQRSLDLSSASRSFEELVGVASLDIPGMLLVSPGNPDDSYLIWKLEGNSGILGSRMPRNSSALPASTINTIRQWITDGALNN